MLISICIIVTAFQLAYADFELELMNSEVDRDEEISDEDTFITHRRNRVKFKDDVIVHKSPYSRDNSTVTPEKTDCCTQTTW